MNYVNISGDDLDPFARYKMPKLLTKLEGRGGNGLKTIITNMVDVAKSLNIDPAYPIKFFGYELGAQTKFDEAQKRAIINGVHDMTLLNTLLQKFINQFILCPHCQLPEITMTPKPKRKIIKISCAACGYDGVLNTDHKLAAYIINHHSAKKTA